MPFFRQFWISCDFLVMDRVTTIIKMRFFVEYNLLIVLVRLQCTLLQYTDIPKNSWFVTIFLKMNSLKATTAKEKDDKKLGKEDNQWSRTGLSQARPHIFLLNADNFTYNSFSLLIRHLAYTIITQ